MGGKNVESGNVFPLEGGGWGSPIPTFSNHETTQKVNIFIKTKNVPKVLKCKMNHKLFFFTNMGFPNGGEGSPTWEKFPHFPVFFLPTSLTWSLFIGRECESSCISGGRIQPEPARAWNCSGTTGSTGRFRIPQMFQEMFNKSVDTQYLIRDKLWSLDIGSWTNSCAVGEQLGLAERHQRQVCDEGWLLFWPLSDCFVC